MPPTSSAPKLSELDFKVVKSLGTGAGSSILLIRCKDLGGEYALKVVKRQDADDDIYVNQAIHEFDAATRLHNPSVLKIYDCRVKKKWFKVEGVELLMEYVDGHALDDCACNAIDQLVLVFINVASALSHMHRRGVYHGDLKPSNIMLSRAGQVKVIDFGTAWIKGQPKDRVQGTPQYMAPEQATERVVDSRTDLYNFGATMYRMFTGEYANLGIPAIGGILDAHARKAPIALRPDLPGTLNETIVRCLETSPDRRPAGFHEVKDQLVAVARHLGLRPDDLKGSATPCDE